MKHFLSICTITFAAFLIPCIQAWGLESGCKTTDDYVEYAKALIADNWKPHYSEESGNILVLFKIKNTGEIYDVKVAKSGGQILDNQATNTLKNLSPLDSFPKIYHCDYMEAAFAFKYYNYKEKKQVEEQSAVEKKKNIEAVENPATFYYK